MKLLSLNDILTSSGKYNERAKSPEVTPTVIANINDLLGRVNGLLTDLGWAEDPSVSSGFRTAASNAATPNAAKKSAHMQGKAVDIVDITGKLSSAILARPDLLKKHGLMMEDRSATPTWVHLDTVARPYRPSYIFKV